MKLSSPLLTVRIQSTLLSMRATATEWRQTMPLMAHLDFMMTGNATLFLEFGELLRNSTQVNCIDPLTDLVDFTSCTRMDGTSDIVDWPQSQRDGYVLSNTSTVIQAYAVAGMLALAEMANATGQSVLCAELIAQAKRTSAAVNSLLWNAKTGLYVDGLKSQAAEHSAWHANAYPLWAGIVPTSRKASVLAFLKSKRMAGSVYGALPFLLGLYNVPSNRGEFALEMLTSCDRHSWCHMLAVGATATMEAWSRGDKPNLSWSQCTRRLEPWSLFQPHAPERLLSRRCTPYLCIAQSSGHDASHCHRRGLDGFATSSARLAVGDVQTSTWKPLACLIDDTNCPWFVVCQHLAIQRAI